MSTPLVSCIMPTCDRRSFVPDAIENFRLQTYPNRELVVVDDGTDAIEDLIPDDHRIRYVRLDGRLTTGAKRNACVRVADGELIAHWDDDDWSSPERLAAQVQALDESDADVCGLRDVYFYDRAADRGWRYRYPERAKPWVAGGTMCYRRSTWEHRPFADVRHGEDTLFVWSRPPLQISVLDRPELYVATIHRRNTSLKRTSGRRWSPVAVTTIGQVLGDAADRYLAHPPRRPVHAPITPNAPERSPHVLVSIPHHGDATHLRGAVDSILAQTHRELTCVVVFDGSDEGIEHLADIDDPRLVRYVSADNRGRYFADQIVLDASDAPYFLVQDSDDWSEPERLEALLTRLVESEFDVCLSHTLEHRGRRVTRQSWPRLHEPAGDRLVHRAAHQGLYRTDAVRSVGGWFAGYRIGFDTSILNLLKLAGRRIGLVDEALYHRRLRAGSLTTAPETGWNSPERRRVVGELEDLHRRARAAVASSSSDAATAIAEIVRAGRSCDDAAALARESARLRTALRGGRSERPAPPARVAERLPGLDAVLERFATVNRGWSISPRGAVELHHRLAERRPRRLLDVGSGLSTAIEAAALAHHGGAVISLEHDPVHAERTRQMLDALGLSASATVVEAPLVEVSHPAGTGPWYAGQPAGTFDFFVVDGPPLRCGGRIATLPETLRHRRRGWEFWLFDAHRLDEVACVDAWRRHHRFDVAFESIDTTGVAVITPRSSGSDAAPVVDGLGISILAGGRPDLLRRTLDGVARRWPEQVDAAFVCALVNGPDEASRAVFDAAGWVDRVTSYDGGVLPIGMATSYVVGNVVARPGVRRVLHLEDDWDVCGLDGFALTRADALLDDPAIGQVRLRHRTEACLARHMVTRRAIEWVAADGHRRAQAHYTFNPSMVRTDVADRVFPAVDELDAQRRFLASGLAVAQLEPGVFAHIGENNSRRATLGRRH